MKNFSFKRLFNLPVLFLGLGVLFQIITLIIYATTGVDEFNASLSNEVLIFSVVTICLGFVLLLMRLFGFDELKILFGNFDLFIIITYLLSLFAFMFFVISKVNYITNVIVSIDGTKISFIFILTVVLFLLSFVLFLLSGIIFKKTAKNVEEGEKQNESKAI